MTELQYYKELSSKVFIGIDIMFRPGIMLNPPNIETIVMFGERAYLECCSYLSRLAELVCNEPESSYEVLKQVFSSQVNVSYQKFCEFLSLFFNDSVDLEYQQGLKLVRGNQFIVIRPTDIPWLLDLIYLISGVFSKEQRKDNPANARVAAILEKIRKAKEKKAKEAAAESGTNPFEIIRGLMERLVISHSFTIDYLKRLNLFQLMSLHSRSQKLEVYGYQMRASMIPMVDHSKDKPFDHWMEGFKYNAYVSDEEESPNDSSANRSLKELSSLDLSQARVATEDEFE